MEILIIILAIAALVGGYFFIKKYKTIDKALFGKVVDYKPFGINMVYISAIIGAIFGCVFLYGEFANKTVDSTTPLLLIYFIYIHIFCLCVYQAILRLDTVGAIIGKSLWMLFSCVLAAVIGAVGSVVIICIIILYLVIAVLGGMIFGSGKKTKIREEDGTEHTVQDMGMFGNIDESGNTWTNKGFGEYEKDN